MSNVSGEGFYSRDGIYAIRDKFTYVRYKQLKDNDFSLSCLVICTLTASGITISYSTYNGWQNMQTTIWN